MVYRDPRTGQFVSGDGGGMGDVFSARLSTTIPAADLAGGQQGKEGVTGEEAILVDFTPYLDSDEVFECREVNLGATLSLPTTATTEGSAYVDFALRSDFGEVVPGRPTHYGAGADREDGVADINHGQSEDDAIMALGHLYAENSVVDTVNALGAGSDHSQDRQYVQMDKAFDQDDEVVIPHYINVDNISDHALVVGFDVRLVGEISELD